MIKGLCPEFGCNYPEGECSGTCQRNAIVATNGPTGEHYSAGSVRVTVIQGGKVDLEYVAHWTGDRRDVLQRAQKMIGLLIKRDEP